MAGHGKSWEVLGGLWMVPGRSWENLGVPGRSWDGSGKSWEVMLVYVKSWEIWELLGGHVSI